MRVHRCLTLVVWATLIAACADRAPLPTRDASAEIEHQLLARWPVVEDLIVHPGTRGGTYCGEAQVGDGTLSFTREGSSPRVEKVFLAFDGQRVGFYPADREMFDLCGPEWVEPLIAPPVY
jgi:hypothetical protein